jgi:hypothetical protein
VLVGSSGGEFPLGKKSQTESYLTQIMKGLSSPAGRDNVKTNITFEGMTNDVALLYQSYPAHAAKSTEWSTYTAGLLFKVGTYVFKVKALTNAKECEETIPVLAEPTERRICGAFRP